MASPPSCKPSRCGWIIEARLFLFVVKLILDPTGIMQFEWAWQNPHISRHLHSDLLSPIALKSQAQYPKTPLSNKPLTKVQVLQFMLTVPPWNRFNLKIMLFSPAAKAWWDEARLAGGTVQTDAARKRQAKQALVAAMSRTSQAKSDMEVAEGRWRERQMVLDKVQVTLRFEGVDGTRGGQAGDPQDDEPSPKLVVNDGE